MRGINAEVPVSLVLLLSDVWVESLRLPHAYIVERFWSLCIYLYEFLIMPFPIISLDIAILFELRNSVIAALLSSDET